jgi:hypothetical protein
MADKTKEKKEPDAYMAESKPGLINGFSIPILNLGHLELPDDKFGCSMIMIGSTRSGKSTLLNYLYKKHFEKFISVLMSNSLQSDAYKMLKKTCVTSDHYHPEVLKDMYKINHSTNNHYKFMVIIDDVTHIRGDKEVQRLMTIYRNSRISCVVCAQGAVMADKLARSNINYVFLGRMNSSSEIERNVKEYLTGHFPSNMKIADKIHLYKQLTQDHQWICLDQINGTIFLTKLRPEQLIGC